jgi:periplasmic mercuric ion binding protein
MMTTLLLLAYTAIAGETADIDVTVKGMVCSFCVQGIEKKFKGESSVDNVKVNLDESLLSIWLKEEQSLSNERIESLVKDSGYNVAEIKRTPVKPKEK